MDASHKVSPPLNEEDSASIASSSLPIIHNLPDSNTIIPPRSSTSTSSSPLNSSLQQNDAGLPISTSLSSSSTIVSSHDIQSKQQLQNHKLPILDNKAIPTAIPPAVRSTKRQPSGSAGLMQHQSLPTKCPSPERYAEEQFTERVPWADEKECIIRGPFDYVSSHPGKDFRSQVIGAFNAWLNVPKERLDVITKVVGMLHEASLLVDDVQDSSELRRGFPVAHSIFGVAQTINSANYIYFFALRELIQLNNPLAISTYAEELVNLHRGQGMDLFWRDTLTCPTEEDYLEMVGNKTGGLFRLGIKLMQAESSSGIDCVPLVDLVGLIFQIRDDYMNLNSKEYSDNKGMCEDLTEGKFSFPVIHSIRADPRNLQLINVLKQKTSDVQIKRYAVKYMESQGSFEYTRLVISTLLTRARALVVELEGEFGRAPGLHKILDKMVIA